MKVFLANAFKRSIKKLHANQKRAIEQAIEKLTKHPKLGELKKGDLAGVRVYKFMMVKQEVLLAYIYEDTPPAAHITLLFCDTRENFYSNLKKMVN